MQTINHPPPTNAAIHRDLKDALSSPKPTDTCYVAVCGLENAGKRTFIKQLEIVANEKYGTEPERQHFDLIVQRFVIQNMRRVISKLMNQNVLNQFNMHARSWERDFDQRHKLFEFAKNIYETMATVDGPTPEHQIASVRGLDNWGLELIGQCKRILNHEYKPSLEDFLRVVPLESSRCDLSDVVWFGQENKKHAFKFFDYNNYHKKSPYNNYKNTHHRIVYIVDFGASIAELRTSSKALTQIANSHTCPIDILFNKAHKLDALDARDRQKVCAAFDLDANSDDPLSSLLGASFREAARSGSCLVCCSNANLVQPSDSKIIHEMRAAWVAPELSTRYYATSYKSYGTVKNVTL